MPVVINFIMFIFLILSVLIFDHLATVNINCAFIIDKECGFIVTVHLAYPQTIRDKNLSISVRIKVKT